MVKNNDKTYPARFIYQNGNATLKVSEEDFNIFIINDENLKYSVDYLKSMIKRRTRKNLDFWLFDISSLDSINSLYSLLNDFNLRVNDDIFIVKFDEQSNYADVWEIYKLSSDQALIIDGLGTWSESNGLNMTTEEKYQRRSNLMVRCF